MAAGGVLLGPDGGRGGDQERAAQRQTKGLRACAPGCNGVDDLAAAAVFQSPMAKGGVLMVLRKGEGCGREEISQGRPLAVPSQTSSSFQSPTARGAQGEERKQGDEERKGCEEKKIPTGDPVEKAQHEASKWTAAQGWKKIGAPPAGEAEENFRPPSLQPQAPVIFYSFSASTLAIFYSLSASAPAIFYSFSASTPAIFYSLSASAPAIFHSLYAPAPSQGYSLSATLSQRLNTKACILPMIHLSPS